MRILVTGFKPFGEETINPSNEVVRKLGDKINDVEIIKINVPVVFDHLGTHLGTVQKYLKYSAFSLSFI